MTTIKDTLNNVLKSIEDAKQHKPASTKDVLLLAVSKRHSVEKIREVYALDQRDFGENYLNEALDKQSILADLDITWHYIGSIQSNKTRKITENFTWVHAVSSYKVAKRLSEQRPNHLGFLNICLQINIDAEESKSGLQPDKDALLTLARNIDELPNIKLRGLMCIPAPKTKKQDECETFNRLAALKDHLNDNGLSLDVLSMGMSGDLDSAIACGATIVRIGTAIFGTRE